MTWRTVRVRPDPDRPPVTELVEDAAACAITEPVLPAGETVGARELERMLAERDGGLRAFALVDVREAHERDIVAIPGSVLVPVAEIADGDGAARLPIDRPVVLYCKSGARSARALAVLRASGRTDVSHLEGGVLAWVREVAPGLPVY